MANKTYGNIGLVGEWPKGDSSWKPANDKNLRALDVLVQCVASSAPTNTPPGSPSDGSFWMVGTTPTGAWAGQANKLARYDAGNTDDSRTASWEFWTPKDGWACTVVNGTTYAHETYRPFGGQWMLTKSELWTGLYATAFTPYGANANTLNNSGLSIWSGSTFVAGMDSTGQVTAKSFVTQSGNVERISNAGGGFFTALTVSGLTNGKLPRASTGGGLFADSCFGDDGTVASCSRKIALAPATTGSASYNVGSNAVSPTSPVAGDVWRFSGSEFHFGANLWSVVAASDTIAAGSGVFFQDAMSPTKGWGFQLGASNDLAIWNCSSGSWSRKLQFSSVGGAGFYGVAAPTSRPAVNAAATDAATTMALVNQIRTHLIACGLVQ